jgi:hypothetical protein
LKAESLVPQIAHVFQLRVAAPAGNGRRVIDQEAMVDAKPLEHDLLGDQISRAATGRNHAIRDIAVPRERRERSRIGGARSAFAWSGRLSG